MKRARLACLFAAALLAVPSGVLCLAAFGLWLHEPIARPGWDGP